MINSTINFDVDIDLANRNDFLKHVDCIPASVIRDGKMTKHNTGVYFQKMPVMPLTGLAALDYKEAEQAGYLKVDFLNNHVYAGVKSPAHLDKLVEQEPLWDMLNYAEIIGQLFQINQHADLVIQHKPQTLEQLAQVLAIIRPAKRHLQGKSWEEIAQTVWEPAQDNSYFFKHSHAISYALVIVVQMNLLREQAA